LLRSVELNLDVPAQDLHQSRRDADSLTVLRLGRVLISPNVADRRFKMTPSFQECRAIQRTIATEPERGATNATTASISRSQLPSLEYGLAPSGS